jgi:hypothetical protein
VKTGTWHSAWPTRSSRFLKSPVDTIPPVSG